MSLIENIKQHLWWVPLGQVTEISAADLNDQLISGIPPQIIDVRTHKEWQKSRIEGAVNVPIQQLKKNIHSLKLDAERPVIAICLSAHRSIPAVRLLHARGFPNAAQLRGGMLSWWKQDFPTIGPD